MPAVNVMIPTLNEAAHIEETVRNARQLGEVFVLDSLSTDGTQELARAAGATVVEHPFENYSRQKNWGLDNLPFTAEWIFILDADERITPKLREEVTRIATSDTPHAGFLVNRVVLFMGRQIKHGGLYPSWNLRFFRRGQCRYEDRSVHEHMVCNGTTARLRHHMLHIRRESIHEYISKHVQYAEMESDEWIRVKRGEIQPERAGRLFKNLLKYRLMLRRDVWPALPMRGTIRFFYMYLVRLGFLDGRPGWHLAMLMANYEFMSTMLYRMKSSDRRAHAAPGESTDRSSSIQKDGNGPAASGPELELIGSGDQIDE